MFKFFGRNFKEKRIYADYAASTPVDIKVAKEMYLHESTTNFGNPSSPHSFGRETKVLLEKSRSNIAKILQTQSNEIIFTSGGTESNNLAIMGIIKNSPIKNPHVITTVIEHSSVLEPIRYLEHKGVSVTYLAVDEKGRVSQEELEKAITQNTVFISIAYANGEVGTIEKIRDIGRLIKGYKSKQPIFFHTDASQAAQFLRVMPNDLFVDLMTIDGSKIYGPKGVGLLFVKQSTPLSSITRGGLQEKGLRPGTENVLGVLGLSCALSIVEKCRDSEKRRLALLRDSLKEKILKSIGGVSVNGEGDILPNFLNICIKGIDAEFLAVRLDKEGIALSSASACRSISGSGSSYVIESIPGKEGCGKSSLRITLGRRTTHSHITRIASTLKRLAKD